MQNTKLITIFAILLSTTNFYTQAMELLTPENREKRIRDLLAEIEFVKNCHNTNMEVPSGYSPNILPLLQELDRLQMGYPDKSTKQSDWSPGPSTPIDSDPE